MAKKPRSLSPGKVRKRIGVFQKNPFAHFSSSLGRGESKEVKDWLVANQDKILIFFFGKQGPAKKHKD